MNTAAAAKMLDRAHAKADKCGRPVVLNIRNGSICQLHTFSPARQADIRAGSEGEIVIEPKA
jgi:hypothetical protein